jgi:CO dehydrogenase maturation factor
VNTKGKTIAITGKGGSGKTTLAAILTGIYAKNQNHKILSIDADSSINLPYALGVEPKQTVAEIRRQIIENPESRAEIKNKPMQNVMQDALETGDGFQLLVMGRPEGPGCFCAINNLLRYGIDNLSKQFDITLIDCEAGPEQVNRRVVDHVDILIIVTDASIRGARVAGSIMEVIQKDKQIQPGCTGLVINRLKGEDKLIREKADQWGLEIFGCIPEDENIADYDAVGKPIIDISEPSSGLSAIKEISERVLARIA